MTSLGYATLDVIPSLKGAAGIISKELSGETKAAGTVAGKQLGTSISTSASHEVSAKMGGLLTLGFKKILPAVGIGAMLAKGFERLNAIDQAKAQLEGLGHSASEVQVIMDSALAAVKGTAYGLGDAAQLAATAVAAGIKPGTELTSVLKTIADTSTIAGSSLGDMGMIFNSVASRGKLMGDDLNQMLGRGIPVLAILAKHYKTTAAEARNLITLGQVDFKNFADAMHEYLGGAALKSGNTFTGAMDNMQAAAGRVGASLLSGVFPQIKEGLGGVTKALDELQGPATAVGDALGSTVKVATELPTPLKVATAAWVAYLAAQKMGVTATVATSLGRVQTGLLGVRSEAMLASQAWRTVAAREVEAAASGTLLQQTMAGVRGDIKGLAAASVTAGSTISRGLGKGLSGALSLVGGPWGAAFLTGTAVLTHFWQAHQEAQQHVSELTGALNEETGALTKNYQQLVITNLQQKGAFDVARSMGISLDLVTKAALGNADAMSQVTAGIDTWFASLDRSTQRDVGTVNFADKLKRAIGDESTAVQKSKDQWEQRSEAQGQSTRATQASTSATQTNTKAILDHVAALNKDADAALKGRQDRLALIQQMQSTSKQAREGAKSFDLNTKAGQDNRSALYSLAQQWNGSAAGLQKSTRLYERVRHEFVQDAVQMGATRKEAKKLADQLLHVPNKLPLDVGQALTGIQRVQRQLAGLKDKKITVTVALNGASHALSVQRQLAELEGRASGGPIAANRAYVVGENGPELFMSGVAGRIIPNGGAARPVGVTGAHGDGLAQAIRDLQREIREATKQGKKGEGRRKKLQGQLDKLQGISSAIKGLSLSGVLPTTDPKNPVTAGTRSALNQWQKDLVKAGGKWTGGMQDQAHSLLATTLQIDKLTKKLDGSDGLLGHVDGLKDKLASAQQVVASLKDTMAQLGDTITSGLAPSLFGQTGEDGNPATASASSILSALTTSTTNGQGFLDSITKLAGEGLDKSILAQLANTTDLGSAASLANTLTPGDISAINSAVAGNSAVMDAIAKQIPSLIYGSDLTSAQGDVSSLVSQIKSTQSQIDQLVATSNQMVSAIKASASRPIVLQLDGKTIWRSDAGNNQRQQRRNRVNAMTR